MAAGLQAFGIASALLGGGMTAIRAALRRFNYELPAWVDVASGIGGLLLLAVGLPLLLGLFLDWLGVPLPANSPWPSTIVYSVICAALIFAAGYLPARIPPRAFALKTNWEPALAESLLLSLDSLSRIKSVKIKVIATKHGLPSAQFFVRMLRHFGWQLEVNGDNGSYIFPAPEIFEGVIVRCRESRAEDSSPIWNALHMLIQTPDTIYFPEDDRFNFVQIEIGDVPRGYYGAPRFTTND